jgi:hypothetical protein
VNAVRDPVVLHHLRVVDRQQARLRVEVPHGVAARVHDDVDEPVRGHDRVRGLIDEVLLQVEPLEGEPLPRVLGQRPDVQQGVLLLALPQLGLGRPPVLLDLYRPLVFRAKAPPQRRRPALAQRQPAKGDQRHDDQDPRPGSHEFLPVIGGSRSYPGAVALTVS